IEIAGDIRRGAGPNVQRSRSDHSAEDVGERAVDREISAAGERAVVKSEAGEGFVSVQVQHSAVADGDVRGCPDLVGRERLKESAEDLNIARNSSRAGRFAEDQPAA